MTLVVSAHAPDLRRNRNVAAVALANKAARIAWALVAHDRHFKAGYAAA